MEKVTYVKNVIRAVILCLAVISLVILSGCTNRQNALSSENSDVEVPEKETEREQSDEMTIYDFETQEIYAQRGENRIYGVIYIPQGNEEKMPTVIFSHGFGGTHSVGTQYAEALAREGYVVYCFDFCGGSPDSRSDGSTLEMSLFTERDDLEAVIDMIQELDYVDSDNLFLMGTSQGGAVSAITAAANQEEIRGDGALISCIYSVRACK